MILAAALSLSPWLWSLTTLRREGVEREEREEIKSFSLCVKGDKRERKYKREGAKGGEKGRKGEGGRGRGGERRGEGEEKREGEGECGPPEFPAFVVLFLLHNLPQ